jgi:hypothetical protein
MATPEDNVWDELERRFRQWLKDIKRQFTPPQPEPVRVPVRVRNPQQDRNRYP